MALSLVSSRAAVVLPIIALFAASPSISQTRVAPTQSAGVASADLLQLEIKRLAAMTEGEVGLAAWRLDARGPRVTINADQSFPMASTFKVAVAGTILSKVDRGELGLDTMLHVDPKMYVPSPVISDRLIHPGVSLSIHNLLELMITQSDNTATDVLTAAAGGPSAVTSWLREQGIVRQRVDRDTAGLLRDFFSLPPGEIGEEIRKAAEADPHFEDRSEQPQPAFENDIRDTTTPAAMATLLDRIFSGKALKADTTKVLIAIMERTRTGRSRLGGRLPEGTVVAHKTGTIGGSVSDVGVITLPGEAGQVVIAFYIKNSTSPVAQRERVIAEIARTVYDFFVFSAPSV